MRVMVRSRHVSLCVSCVLCHVFLVMCRLCFVFCVSCHACLVVCVSHVSRVFMLHYVVTYKKDLIIHIGNVVTDNCCLARYFSCSSTTLDIIRVDWTPAYLISSVGTTIRFQHG